MGRTDITTLLVLLLGLVIVQHAEGSVCGKLKCPPGHRCIIVKGHVPTCVPIKRPGTCPRSDIITICLVRKDACRWDWQCRPGQKCCRFGCNRICLPACIPACRRHEVCIFPRHKLLCKGCPFPPCKGCPFPRPICVPRLKHPRSCKLVFCPPGTHCVDTKRGPRCVKKH